jgi:hypothetical protein
MSRIADVYEQIILYTKNLFPLKTRIPYPYNLEVNPIDLMNDGWGIKVGPASYEEFETCRFMVNRQISIIFTREAYRTQVPTETIDKIVKEMLDNVYEVQNLFYSQNQLGIEQKITAVTIDGVSELSEVYAGSGSYLSMEASFTFKISEKLQ